MSKQYQRGIQEGYRSGLETKISKQLEDLGIDGEYEQHKIKYEQPAKSRTYTPDFWLKGPNHTIIIESKGRFTVADRQKHLMIKKSKPELDIRFVFNNSRTRISKTSKTTYGMWCEKHGFKYADRLIPLTWIEETK